MRFLSLKLLILTFILNISSSEAQTTGLPKDFSASEIVEMQDQKSLLRQKPVSINQTFPSTPMRAMAEWEEIQALVVAWVQYQPTLREIVRYSREECRVIIVCNDSFLVKDYLREGKVPLSNITYLQTPVNSAWIRDYGAMSVYSNEVDSLILFDWIYNRPRPFDDQMPFQLSKILQKPLYSMTSPPNDLVHIGGNFMTDGMGTGFSTYLVLDENSEFGQFNLTSKTEEDIDWIMNSFMGIDQYIKLPTLPYDGIHHIDMHMKLLDEETLLVGEYPLGIADGPQIEANIQYIQNNYYSPFGTPYEIVRIPMPPHHDLYPDNIWSDYRTYTNAVFVNKTILVPSYEEKYDSVALRIYRNQFPGYRVVGIDCNEVIKAGGALHCITREIGVNDPLLIRHRHLLDVYENHSDYQVSAYIKHSSGIEHAKIYYATDKNGPFQEIDMVRSPTRKHVWTGFIPVQNSGEKVFYYISATANSGKTISRPLTAPAGYWQFDIIGPNTKIEDYFQTEMLPDVPPFNHETERMVAPLRVR
ncbi:MAG: agmatine deiminase family protein [Bacteroidetes bacterium]|nr:agmatine deiminase family protein [Bacteroidota bacterium]